MYNVALCGISWGSNDFKHLTIKSTLYTVSAYRKVQKFGPFHSITSRFRDVKNILQQLAIFELQGC